MSNSNAPAPSNLPQVDLSHFCSGGVAPDPTVGQQTVLIGDLTLEPVVSVLNGTWDIPQGASLTLDGSEAILEFVSGSVTVVSCGGPLIFDTIRGDGVQFEAAAATGVQLDSATTEEAYLDIAQSGGAVVIRADTAARIVIEIKTESVHAAICAAAQCWGLDDRTTVFDPATRIDPCILNICWGK